MFYRMIEDFLDDGMFSVAGFSGLPGIYCDICGQIWGNSNSRLRMEYPDGYFGYRRQKPISLDEFNDLKKQIMDDLGGEWLIQDIEPGVDVGFLSLESASGRSCDFTMPASNAIVVSQRFISFLMKSFVTGWKAHPVIINGSISNDFYEIEIIGNAGLALCDPPIEILYMCNGCGRKTYSDYGKPPTVNNNLWDGSDISKFDGVFGGYIIISEKLGSLLKSESFEGFKLDKL